MLKSDVQRNARREEGIVMRMVHAAVMLTICVSATVTYADICEECLMLDRYTVVIDATVNQPLQMVDRIGPYTAFGYYIARVAHAVTMTEGLDNIVIIYDMGRLKAGGECPLASGCYEVVIDNDGNGFPSAGNYNLKELLDAYSRLSNGQVNWRCCRYGKVCIIVISDHKYLKDGSWPLFAEYGAESCVTTDKECADRVYRLGCCNAVTWFDDEMKRRDLFKANYHEGYGRMRKWGQGMPARSILRDIVGMIQPYLPNERGVAMEHSREGYGLEPPEERWVLSILTGGGIGVERLSIENIPKTGNSSIFVCPKPWEMISTSSHEAERRDGP